MEACPRTAWLHDGPRARGFAALCIETRRANAAMRAMPNKTDRDDARALARVMRTGWFRQVHVRHPDRRLKRSLPVARRTVPNGMRSIENVARALPGEAGIRPGTPARSKFAAAVRAGARDDDAVTAMATPLLTVPAVMLDRPAALTKQALDAVRADPVCRRLMSVPGVGPMTALAFRATIDDPARFHRSRDAGAHPGLTPPRYQSGGTDRQGRISRRGDEPARTALREAARGLLARGRKWSSPRARGMPVAKRRGMTRARAAVAGKLAVIPHRMWRDGSEFRFGADPGTA